MMEIDVTTPALLFPAISLLLLAYTNRFLGIAQLIRTLNQRINDKNRDRIKRQVDNLRHRVILIIRMQAAGIISLLLCTISMLTHFIEATTLGLVTFAFSLALMLLSLLISLQEILISGNALRVELEGLEKH